MMTSRENEEYHLASAVRVVNLLRSLRGQFGRYPELRTLLNEANRELSELRSRS